MRFFSTRQKGFTLVEIVLVAAIIAIVAAVVVANIQGARKKSRDTQRVSDMAQIQLALRLYKDANGTYPDCASGMQIATGQPLPAGCAVNVVTAITQYLPAIPKDPRNTASGFVYFYDSSHPCVTDGQTHIVLFARTTEQTNTGNWNTICNSGPGGGPPVADVDGNPRKNDSAPDYKSYGIILK